MQLSRLINLWILHFWLVRLFVVVVLLSLCMTCNSWRPRKGRRCRWSWHDTTTILMVADDGQCVDVPKQTIDWLIAEAHSLNSIYFACDEKVFINSVAQENYLSHVADLLIRYNNGEAFLEAHRTRTSFKVNWFHFSGAIVYCIHTIF